MHFILIIVIGRVAVRSILFPYSNKIITNYLDGELNKKFGLEFTKILEKALKIMKDKMLKKEEIKP